VIGPLPPLVVVTDGQRTSGRSLTAVIAAAIDGGTRAVLLREKHLACAARAALAVELQAILDPVGGLLIVASDPTIPAGGVHLAAADPFPEAAVALVGRSCHNTAELRHAAAQGCSYATLSPIFSSPSKPGYGPALTPAALRDTPLPTWALGGVDATNAADCCQGGAAGVAVMGAIMRARDPASVAAQILEALATAGSVGARQDP
jgi:thiamine-phosphate pyrophosphorylase